MRITIVTIGSRGDVQPYVALGLGLKREGHRVTLATHQAFQDFVVSHGLHFAPMAGGPRTLVEGKAGTMRSDVLRDPVYKLRRVLQIARPHIHGILEDTWRVCQGAEAIVCSTFGLAGYLAAEKLEVPCYMAPLLPWTPTRAFPSFWVPQSLRLGGSYNRLTHILGGQLFWLGFRKYVNEFRVRRLDMRPLPWLSPERILQERRIPFLYGYSPAIIPKPPDWPDWVHVTGFWYLDGAPSWQPPAELVTFLRSGPPPVYVGFGSMPGRDPHVLTHLVIEALTKAGQRGILYTGAGALARENLPSHVLCIESAPHDWLFPRMAAVVHHAGAGTFSAGLRAGVPTVAVPFIGDQSFWGELARRLGVGPRPIPYTLLTSDRLAEAIHAAIFEREIRERAAEIGRRMRQEDGVSRAVVAFEKHLAGDTLAARIAPSCHASSDAGVF